MSTSPQKSNAFQSRDFVTIEVDSKTGLVLMQERTIYKQGSEVKDETLFRTYNGRDSAENFPPYTNEEEGRRAFQSEIAKRVGADS